MTVSEEMVRRFCAEDVDQIQGFTYKERSVIRDFRNDRCGVEIWSQPHTNDPGRDSAEMQVRLQFERTRAALTAALSDQVVVPNGHGLSVNIEQRADGGIRVWSSQLKGLLLSGSDPVQVMAAVWPAITALVNHKRFKTGDRVQHVGRGEFGTVTILENGNVRVEFDNPTPRGHRSIGEYDKTWFEQYPNGLAAAPASTAGEVK